MDNVAPVVLFHLRSEGIHTTIKEKNINGKVVYVKIIYG